MPPAPPPQPDSWQQAAFADRPNRISGLATPPPLPIPELPAPIPPAPRQIPLAPSPQLKQEQIPQLQRYMLAGATIFVIALAAASTSPGDDYFPWFFFSFACMIGALIGLIVGRRFILPKVPPEAGFVARISLGGPAALFGLIASLPGVAMTSGHGNNELGKTWLGLVLPIAILNWIKWTGPQRVKRVSLGIALTAAAFGLLMTAISSGSIHLGIGILAAIALAAQVLFPWEPRMYVPPVARQAGELSPGLLNSLRHAGLGLRHAQQQVADAFSPRPRVHYAPPATPKIREVPDWARWIWRGGMALLISLGPVLIAAAESNDNGRGQTDFVLMRAAGVGALILGVFCFFQSFRRRINGWWSYLIKPLILFTCLQIILISAFLLGFSGPNSDIVPAGVFFIIFPAIMFLTLLFVQTKPPRPATTPAYIPAGTPPPLPQFSPPAPASDFQPAHQPSASPTPSSLPSSFSSSQRRPQPRTAMLPLLAAFVGMSLHLGTLCIALATALDLPGFIEAGIVDQRLPNELRQTFGQDWVKLAHLQGYIFTYIGAFLATLFLMLARRSQGIAHMLRPIFAAACFLIATVMLDHSLIGQWKVVPLTPRIEAVNQTPRSDVGASITTYLDASNAKFSIVSLIFAMAGLALLLWPASNPSPNDNSVREEGVS